jgi:hypothetical protein
MACSHHAVIPRDYGMFIVMILINDAGIMKLNTCLQLMHQVKKLIDDENLRCKDPMPGMKLNSGMVTNKKEFVL